MLKQTLLIFLYILAFTIIASAIFITMSEPEAFLSVMFLWQAILLSALCALSTFIFYSKHELRKGQLFIRKIVHFTMINIIMLIGSIHYQWIRLENIWNIIIMLLLIAAVYFMVGVAEFHKHKIVANQLNERLEKLQNNDES